MIQENKDTSSDSGKMYWKSLNDYAESPQFRTWVENEFPNGASLFEDTQRRSFMKLMAASFGLAGLGFSGCRRPEHEILPYGKSPEELIPGVPNYYATAMPTTAGYLPLIVESHEGRPTKIEGNPSYVPFGGSTDIYAQASVLNLYDPDRARGSFQKEQKTLAGNTSIRWKKIQSNSILSRLNDWSSSGKVAILANSSYSLARQELVGKLQDKGVLWAEFDSVDSISFESELAAKLNSKRPVRAIPKLKNASRVLSLDCDFMGNREPYSLANSRSFMSGRKVNKPKDSLKMNRLYSVEADMTITGGVADHRLRLESSRMKSFLCLLGAEILKTKTKNDTALIKKFSDLGKGTSEHLNWARICAKDLLSANGKSLILAGNHLDAETHLIVYFLNGLLGSLDKTVSYVTQPFSSNLGLQDLVSSINDGNVDTLIMLGGNPVHATSGFIDWEDISQKVENTVRIGFSIDESSQFCDYHIGCSHYLESWDLGLTWDCTSVIPIQPLIAPLFDTKSDIECLLSLSGDSNSSHDYIQSLFEKNGASITFKDFLRLGVFKKDYTNKLKAEDLRSYLQENLKPSVSDANANFEVLLVPDFHALDGSFINNGWMQECPHPITKLTWDNALLISPKMAKELESKFPDIGLLPKPTLLNQTGEIAPDNAVFENGYQKSPVVELSVAGGKKIAAPLYVQPGLADKTVVASLGMGRKNTGRVGCEAGFDSYPLLSKQDTRVLPVLEIKPTGSYKILANTQEHWSMEGRAIIREANAEKYSKNQDFATQMGAESHSPPIWGKDQDTDLAFKSTTTPRGNSSYEHPDHTYEKSETHGIHQWGMAIDLNQCTGCSACVVACQSENNIPIVGKDQVLRGREMHWMRLDRYYSSAERNGDEIPSDVQVSFQGVACMHCETAPCESVCPVTATVHDEEGLNAMAYNRCVGTRYCANNCPYKVRRFNFFDWNKRDINQLYQGPLGDKNDSLPAMGKNPDVTVRMRGVMEKCTYCVQRIQEAKIRVKVKAQRNANLATGNDGTDLKLSTQDIKVPDGTIRPACQQVCPSDGVAFGDLSDPNSRVSQLKNDPRDYAVLGYLNTRPRTSYLAKVRNPNPAMPDFSDSPHSYREYHDKAYPSHH